MAEPHVVSALKDKRAEVSGVIADLEKRIAQRRADLAHVDAVLRLFAPEVEPETIAPKRPAPTRNGWFKVGECFRLAMDVLRDAPEPLATREIIERLMIAKGLDPADARTRELVHKTAMGTLNRAHELVERLEVDGVVAWRVRE